MRQSSEHSEPNEVLYRIKRGLAGYVSYLAACDMNESFSEYVLYEPILRVLTSRGYKVKCEVPCLGIEQPDRGDRKRLDFVAEKGDIAFAMEVKWARSKNPQIAKDVAKLTAFRQTNPAWRAFLCIFGTKSCIKRLNLDEERLSERGGDIIAEFGRTRYGCRIYELAKPLVASNRRGKTPASK
jgi:hypothetical protein